MLVVRTASGGRTALLNTDDKDESGGIKEDDTPSCSVRMSLASQGLFVNDIVVRWAGQFLYELFSTGLLRQHGVVVNLDAKRCGPIDVDPAVWKRFGVRRRRPRGLSEN